MKTADEVKDFIRLEIANAKRASEVGKFLDPNDSYKEHLDSKVSQDAANFIIPYLEWLLTQIDDPTEYFKHHKEI